MPTVNIKHRIRIYIFNLLSYQCDFFLQVVPDAQNLTGLSKQILSSAGKSCFDKNIAQQIRLFLERQQQPICLVAHNGSDVDFPILASNLTAVGCELPQQMNLKCGDSLRAFINFKSSKQKHRDGPYKLATLYREAFGFEFPDEHSAEGDTIALMKVVIHAGDPVISWFERNSVKSLSEYDDDKRKHKAKGSKGSRR